MKVLAVILCVLMLLSGCSEDVFETIADSDDISVMATPATVLIDLPDTAAISVMEGMSGKLYFCDGYEIMVETLNSGNLDATLKTLTGFGKEEIRSVQTMRCGVSCYEGAWSSAGEAGDQIGRVMVLDDGNYHYCISMVTAAKNASDCQKEWQDILDSVSLTEG